MSSGDSLYIEFTLLVFQHTISCRLSNNRKSHNPFSLGKKYIQFTSNQFSERRQTFSVTESSRPKIITSKDTVKRFTREKGLESPPKSYKSLKRVYKDLRSFFVTVMYDEFYRCKTKFVEKKIVSVI